MFANPVPGAILANKDPWPGPPTFRQTRTFAQHVAAGDGPGNDFGNQREGADVFAAADGKIVEVFRDPGNGANIVRIEHPALAAQFGGQRVVTGYAHLQKLEVAKVAVARGQLIGHVGSTGAPGQPHLHFGLNVGGKEVDGWPFLAQNSGDMVKGTWIQHVVNRKTKTLAGARFRAGPTLADAVLATFPAGADVLPVAGVTGQLANGTTLWYVAIMDTTDADSTPDQLGYFHSSVLEPLVASEATGGHSDAELKASADAAAAKAASAVAAASVSEAKSYEVAK